MRRRHRGVIAARVLETSYFHHLKTRTVLDDAMELWSCCYIVGETADPTMQLPELSGIVPRIYPGKWTAVAVGTRRRAIALVENRFLLGVHINSSGSAGGRLTGISQYRRGRC
jgi:hypothetical protein